MTERKDRNTEELIGTYETYVKGANAFFMWEKNLFYIFSVLTLKLLR